MTDNVTHTVAVAGACAPFWASMSLSGALQLVSLVWITLQVANFIWSKWKGRKATSHSDDFISE